MKERSQEWHEKQERHAENISLLEGFWRGSYYRQTYHPMREFYSNSPTAILMEQSLKEGGHFKMEENTQTEPVAEETSVTPGAEEAPMVAPAEEAVEVAE